MFSTSRTFSQRSLHPTRWGDLSVRRARPARTTRRDHVHRRSRWLVANQDFPAAGDIDAFARAISDTVALQAQTAARGWQKFHVAATAGYWHELPRCTAMFTPPLVWPVISLVDSLRLPDRSKTPERRHARGEHGCRAEQIVVGTAGRAVVHLGVVGVGLERAWSKLRRSPRRSAAPQGRR